MANRKRLYEVLEKSSADDPLSRGFDGLIITLILVNVVALVAESFEPTGPLQVALSAVESTSIAVFSVEYVLRLWTARERWPQAGWLGARLLFIVSPLGLIDLLAVMPFYLPVLFSVDLRIVRLVRLVRFLRLLKLTRYTRSLELVGKVVRERREELVVTVFVTLLLLLVAATLMYYLEHDVQPDAFPNILATVWWAVATLTTIGYGDVYPVTGWGRFLSGVIALIGIGLVALPTGILSSGFVEALNRNRRDGARRGGLIRCPHCGRIVETAEAHEIEAHPPDGPEPPTES